MEYIDLIKSGADPTDTRAYLTSSDAVAATIRIPVGLRDSAKKAELWDNLQFIA